MSGLWHEASLSFTLDVRGMGLEGAGRGALTEALSAATSAMAALESGAIANRDEQRMVGHYWLRNPALAPDEKIRSAIAEAQVRVESLAADVRRGEITTPEGERFERAILVGIGGSALGPQLLVDALSSHGSGLTFEFVDNTDPDGIDRVLARTRGGLGRSLVVVMSKSGGTVETRNGMLELQAAFEREDIAWAPRAVAVTQPSSALDRMAEEGGWLARLPLWSWVGGRTSVTSAVGLLAVGLLGGDIRAFLAGAARMDELTRVGAPDANPACLLAASWYLSGAGHGRRAMVVLPYRDRLSLFARYLQQLVMESVGKAVDRQGKQVGQGLTVYGNKGSTDQHAYVQQLLDGPDDFFATFVEVLRDADPARPFVAAGEGAGSGDFLSGFLHGTRAALADRGRGSLLITLATLDERSLGALIALFERAVGIYAELVDVNAYHQPGVEAGKLAAAELVSLMGVVHAHLVTVAGPGEDGHGGQTPDEVADAIGEKAERVFVALRHMEAQPHWSIRSEAPSDTPPWRARYSVTA